MEEEVIRRWRIRDKVKLIENMHQKLIQQKLSTLCIDDNVGTKAFCREKSHYA